MKVVWSGSASRRWSALFVQCMDIFGKSVAKRSLMQLERKLSSLESNPEMGFPEPLLAGKGRLYRALIFSKNYKLIYYVGSSEVRIVDIWDMRMNPSALKKRIK